MNARAWIGWTGAAGLAVAWVGPLPEWSRHSFSAHMTLHMTVVAVGAGLVAFGWSGSDFDPARRWPRFFAPLPASAAELLVVWAWHAPTLHHLARRSEGWFAAEQASFLLVGLWLWTAAFGRSGERAMAGVVGLLVTSMHMTLLGALLGLARRSLYVHGGTAGFGLAPLEDQQLGGAIMLLVGGASYLAGGLWLMAGVLRERYRPREESA